jgi:trans-aconitate 2-methyltransferase
MSDWNSEQYLRFKLQRTQPAIDLAQRARSACSPKDIVDLGCGPGNSTEVLRKLFPDAGLLGIDSSPNMITKARGSYPDLHFLVCDINALDGGHDLLFSNACLQWLPDHELLLPTLMGKLNVGGVLAVQIPMNGDEPLFRIIKEVVSQSIWDFSKVCFENNDCLEPHAYFDILSGCSSSFDMWETVYYHAMPSHDSLLEWVRGTRLRPYLEALDDRDARSFQEEILERVRRTYPVLKSGEVVLRFRRFFFIARK